MAAILDQLTVLFLALMLVLFPGVLVVKWLVSGVTVWSRWTCVCFTSIGFWVCFAWLVSICALPLGLSAAIVGGISVAATLVVAMKGQLIGLLPNTVKLHHIVLAMAIAVLLLPLTFLTIPPGCDTAMHGYITRLVVNSNGLPHSYRPILPVNYFGSYSAGYHVFTALVSGMQVKLLRPAIILCSLLVYPLSLLALVFLLQQLVPEKYAVYAAVIFWGANHTYQSTINWGGNPTMLGFAFCLFAVALLLYATHFRNRVAMLLLAIPMAAIPLVHAIPAAVLVYLSPLGLGLLFVRYWEYRKWLALWFTLAIISGIALLVPFLSHFQMEHGSELSAKIWDWQNLMMNNTRSKNLFINLMVTAEQIKYRTGDFPIILAGLALVLLLVKRQLVLVLQLMLFMSWLYLLIFNFAYWLLPLSELLYPERTVFFMIAIFAVLFAEAMYAWRDTFFMVPWRLKAVNPTSVIGIVLSAVSLLFMNAGNNGLRKSNIQCGPGAVSAFEWLNRHADTNALVVVSYNDIGMWVPTFTNIPALGTHLHYIHEIGHVNELLEARTGPRYFFVTRRDEQDNNAIYTNSKRSTVVFANAEVTIRRQ